MRPTTSLRKSRLRSSSVMARSQSHWPLPVPLVDVGGVVVVEEVVLADRLHVGVDALARLATELAERDALPLRRRLHDLRVEPLLQAQPARELHGRARAVPVQHVVDAALPRHDERHLDHLEVQLLAEAVLDEALDLMERLHPFQGPQERLVVGGEDALHLLVGADPRTRQVCLLVRHRRSFLAARGISRVRLPVTDDRAPQARSRAIAIPESAPVRPVRGPFRAADGTG
jgi:hypothetical protein